METKMWLINTNVIEHSKIGNYELVKKIGSGAFGDVYLGRHTSTHAEVAIKMEKRDTAVPQLYHEAKILKALKGSKGIPDVKHFIETEDYSVMIFELLGPSLEDLFKYWKRKFSLKTVIMIAAQALDRIKTVQTNHLIHRDIKPDNFLIGSLKAHRIYLVDFGLTKRFRDPKTGMHIPWKEGKNLTGTARYASLSTHLGFEQSRRDDLESLAYVLIYFIKGQLPWQGLPAKTKKEKYKKIKEIKENTPIEELCEGLPSAFLRYLNYWRCLKFEDKPWISDLKELFIDLFEEKGYSDS